MKDSKDDPQHDHPLKTVGCLLVSPLGMVLLIFFLILI
jgi:hypothetical protein